jgi:hypothetical protein
MERWSLGITFLDNWSYFDSHEKKPGWLRLVRNKDSTGGSLADKWNCHMIYC